ncbi:MAG: hypothetical protein MJ211_06905 [Bacteroidales bacterium]|nr:hypothetical protein [Bacteroidales bacterium]
MTLDYLYNNYVYILMPLISGLIGYITNVLAIKMTFYPIDYFGIRPFGWQGIIPSKTTKMASKSVDLLTRDLFKTSEVFSKLEPKEVSEICKEQFISLSKQITKKVMHSRMPFIWEHSSYKIKTQIENSLAQMMPEIVENSMAKIKNNIDDLIDLKSLAITSLKEDKSLINKIFLDLGGKEFRFIEVSGLYLGMLFGIGQIFTSMYTNHWIMFLTYGIFIGYITNYLAIKLIFEPIEPIKFGPIVLWGLFLKRQKEESYRYAQIISEKILTVENLFNAIFRSSNNTKIQTIMETEVSVAIDKIFRELPFTVKLLLPSDKIKEFKSVALFELMCEMPVYIRIMFPYAEKTLDIQNTIGSKMASLPPKKFIDFLRPAFQEDEWKLILVGAILGGLAGILQYFLS